MFSFDFLLIDLQKWTGWENTWMCSKGATTLSASTSAKKMAGVQHFTCPACSPDMLAVCADGNRKQYRFRQSKGLFFSFLFQLCKTNWCLTLSIIFPSLFYLRSEEPYFDGTFIAKDADVDHFVEDIKRTLKSVSKIYCVIVFAHFF